ncbi:MAG: hypothetical protein V2A76_15575 [Planctomycetota bacterium]
MPELCLTRPRGMTRSGRLGCPFRVVVLAASLACVMGCASEEPEGAPPGPVDSISRALLLRDVPVDSALGYETATVNVHSVVYGNQECLAIVVEDGEDLPLLLYIPARVRLSDGGALVTLSGEEGRKLTAVLPVAGQDAEVEIDQFFSSFELTTDYPDERRDSLHIELDSEEDLEVTVEVSCERYGPPGFMGFGREVLYEQAPVRFILRRALSTQAARVWMVRNK